jgi:hypothetical protein
MTLVPPVVPPVDALNLTYGSDAETVMSVAAAWLRATGASDRALIAVDQRTTLDHYDSLRPLKKLPSIASRNVGLDLWAGKGPILALDPSRELLLKVTNPHLSRASSVLLVNFAPGDAFTNRWLCAAGATDLVKRQKYPLPEQPIIDPVVLAAFEELKESLLGQLCTPEHSHDPNGVAVLRELKKKGHDLDENALAVWAIFSGYTDRDVTEFIGHVAKVKRNHAYQRKTLGSWKPNYVRWAERSTLTSTG